MPFDLSALSNYVKDNADVLISSLITGSKTASIIQSQGNVQTGIKTSERIGIFETDAVFQDGDGCGFNASGTTAISQRTITVGNVKLEDSLCVNQLEKKYTQLMMKVGNSADTLPNPIERAYVDRKMSLIESQIEKALWQGDTASGNGNLNKFDGYLKHIDTSVGAVAVNAKKGIGTITSTTGAATVAGTNTLFSSTVAVGDKIYSGSVLIGTVQSVGSNTALTLAANGAAAVTGAAFTVVPAAYASSPILAGGVSVSNILAVVDSVILAIPEAVMDNETDRPIMFMGWDWARLYLMALKNANLYHFTSEESMLRNGFNVPGFDIRVEPTPGLSGTGRIVVASPNNMWMGTDLENEQEEIDMWYEKKDDALLSRIRFKMGTQFSFPSEVTQFTGA